MEIIIEKGCGLDVHKGTVVACIITLSDRLARNGPAFLFGRFLQ